jgi:hypothetical protein
MILSSALLILINSRIAIYITLLPEMKRISIAETYMLENSSMLTLYFMLCAINCFWNSGDFTSSPCKTRLFHGDEELH